jgi:3-isopropylmalate/(R)-2-methylmalate dehydratase small subunit
MISETMGKAWIFGDDIDTDALAPGKYMKFDMDEIARHCLESVDPAFAARVAPGDVVVGGRNFGLGSSREQAPGALRHLGVTAVIATSFAGLFYRNALNLGLAVLACPDASRIQAGDAVRINAEAGRIENQTTGETLACEPIPPHLMEMVRDGGLLPHLEKRLARARNGRNAQ